MQQIHLPPPTAFALPGLIGLLLAGCDFGSEALGTGSQAAAVARSCAPFCFDFSQIVYRSASGQGWQIRTMGGDGLGDTEVIAANDPRHPVLSPDRTRIAFTDQVGAQQKIFIVDVDGTHLTQVTGGTSFEQDPSWSTDGLSLVFASSPAGPNALQQIYIDSDLGATTSIDSWLQVTAASTWYVRAPMFNPANPSQIVLRFGYVSWGSGITTGIATVTMPNLSFTPIPENSWQGVWTAGAGGAVLDGPAYSPDGTRIAFSTLNEGFNLHSKFIVSVPSTGGALTLLASSDGDESWPTWKDNTTFAFSSSRSYWRCSAGFCLHLNTDHSETNLWSQESSGAGLTLLTHVPSGAPGFWNEMPNWR
jgi:hypothetical protein